MLASEDSGRIPVVTIPVIGVEPAIPEVPDDEVAAEAAEVGRRPGEAHGALSPPPRATRARNVPSVRKTSTTPRPWPARSSSLPGCVLAYVTNSSPFRFWIPNGA